MTVKYDLPIDCPKCGQRAVWDGPRYQPATYRDRPEHLAFACATCRYVYTLNCQDAPNAHN